MMKKLLKNKPAILLAVAAILLLASTVGSTQAALTYYSETYMAEVTVSNIGVTLTENGAAVSHRNYLQDDKWDDSTGALLKNMLPEGEKLVLGKAYPEAIAVTNSGAIDSYVRVILKKSWVDENGMKDTNLSPDLIDLNLVTGNGWVVDSANSTPERTVLYYTSVLPVGASTPAVTDTLTIDPAVATKMIKTVTGAPSAQTITYEYEYNGYTFNIEAEVDAVQTHNAADAIKSAWGVDVAVSGTSLSLQ